ncbi:hypothetical protein KR215_004565 [Drosophila sulfurigaster]|nr:hypothetical protein KR215_004565 [Drosophila sulfurigaster]
MPPKHRDVSPFFQLLRDFLLGRKHVTSHRHADTLSPRTLPPYKPFDESQSRLSNEPYYARDARCLVRPPIDLVEQKKRQEAAKAAAEAAKAAKEAADAAKAAAAAVKNAPGDCNAAGPQPKAEAKKPDAPSKDSKQEEKKDTKAQQKRKLLPTPGQMHNWD